MITDFNQWLEELRSNKLWYIRIKEMHPRKNLMKIAMEVHTWLLAKEDDRDMPSTRALFQTFANKAADGTAIVNVVVDEPVKSDWQPVSWEKRAEWLDKYQEAINAMPMLKPAWKPTSKQQEEEGQVRPKSVQFKRSPIEMLIAAKEAVKDAQNARRKLFLEAFSDADEEEIQAYIAQFAHIDNPDNL